MWGRASALQDIPAIHSAHGHPEKRLQTGARRHPRLVGLWHSIGHATVTEILADSGFDWILIDTEHAPNETPMVADQLRAASLGSRVAGRPPCVERPAILNGCSTSASRRCSSPTCSRPRRPRAPWPRRGTRRGASAAWHRCTAPTGTGGSPTTSRGRTTRCACWCSWRRARRSMRWRRSRRSRASTACSSDHPICRRASGFSASRASRRAAGIEDACRRAQAIRKPIGILAPVEEDAAAWLDMGFAFVAVGGDILCLRKAVDALAQRFRAPRHEPA